MSDCLQYLASRAKAELRPILEGSADSAEAKQRRADDLKAFLVSEDKMIRGYHEQGAAGLVVAGCRADMIDTFLQTSFEIESEKLGMSMDSLSLIAVGGYGRAELNPGSDIDLLFLLPKPAHSYLKKSDESQLIQNILYILWDTGFKVGHSSRSVTECIREAKAEQQSKTAMMDARLLAGNEGLFGKLIKRVDKECLQQDQQAFLDLRTQDLISRHAKSSHTVFLQEPHVKESCGGLRDFHNILWVARAKLGTSDLSSLVEENIITEEAREELEVGYDFLHRVRNELHYYNESNTDILTLRLQGVVATNFKYPQESILRRCEAFMKDYYTHTRNINRRTLSVMEIFELEFKEEEKSSWKSIFSSKEKHEVFDGFIAKDGLIYTENEQVLGENTHRLMRVFQHCQIKGLALSPEIRIQIKSHLHLVDKKFQQSKSNRETFRAILSRKGDVATALRMMHRVGVLDNYITAFGALDCLVQHEFFHRYTADEHTLRCIDELDALVDNDERNKEIYRDIFMKHEDPYALFIALIMHDTGRAENVREHIDGSAILTSEVCTQLRISGARRSLITFLVDHHLTFWKYATNRNLDDPAVIEEFAGIMGNKERLSALFLFTYADSNGTNEDGWSPWKEALMVQLHRSTMQFFNKGQEKYKELLDEEKSNLLEETKDQLDEKYHEQMAVHFDAMPTRYFRFRDPHNIARHIRCAAKFIEADEKADSDKEADIRWVDQSDRGYTELVLCCWNAPLLLEKVCCALASEELNIIAADVYTRTDNMVCDVFKVCTSEHQSITSANVRKRVAEKVKKLIGQEGYEPSEYLKKKKNYLRKNVTEGGIPFPVIAYTNNHLSDTCTAIEIQAEDRIGLMHDLFATIGKQGLATVHARICTEKGAAVDTIYVSHPQGGKIEDPEQLKALESELTELLN